MRFLIALIFVLTVAYGDEVKPVNVDIFYETLCGDSIRFIKEQLFPTYNALRKTGIVKFNLYPYGKANQTNIKGMWYFTCQHHEKECELNLVEACASYIYPQLKFINFANCVAFDKTMAGAFKCAKKHGMTWNLINHCRFSKWGNEIQHTIGLITEDLKPKLTNVPWIVVNDRFDLVKQKLALKDLKTLICNSYEGVRHEECQ